MDTPPPAPPIDRDLFRHVMGHFTTGVTVVSFLRTGVPAGVTVNAFMSVSLEPPLILISMRAGSSFARCVARGDHFGVNILGAPQQHLAGHFAQRGVPAIKIPFDMLDGTPVLHTSLALLVARTVDIHPAGDHLLYIAQVGRLALGAPGASLLFHRGRYTQLATNLPEPAPAGA